MPKVMIASQKLVDARAFAELNGLQPNEWTWMGTAMALRGRPEGEIFVVKGLDKVMNGELAIWAGYKNGKLRHVDPLTRVNLG